MTLTLGMMFCAHDLPYLRLHLPVYMEGFRSDNKLHIIAASSDGTYTDSYKFMKELGADVTSIQFNWNWSKFWNELLGYAQARGATKLLRLDPDELIWQADVQRIDALLDAYSFLAFPRHNFFYDRTQVNVNAHPDLQARAWRMDGRIQFQGEIHEGVAFSGNPNECAHIHQIHLWHFGDIGKANIQRRALMYINYQRRKEGLAQLERVPDDQQPGAQTARFVGKQPIDPLAIGKYAPFSE